MVYFKNDFQLSKTQSNKIINHTLFYIFVNILKLVF